MTGEFQPLDALPVVGALDVERTPTGAVFRRLPAWTRSQLADPAQQLVTTMPAGVRLEFSGSTPWIELIAMVTAIKIADLPCLQPTFDVVIDGQVRDAVVATDHAMLHITGPAPAERQLIPGNPATIRVDGLPTDSSTVIEIWLPHASLVELQSVRIAPGCRIMPAARSRHQWVHYGSSISHCLEAPRPTETWPALVARRANVSLMNLAVGGQCMLDQYVARTIRDLDADVISIKAGINIVNGDTMRERTFRAALHGFLDTVRDGHPDTPIALITPIICPDAEERPGPTALGPDGRFHAVPRTAELSVGSLTLRRVRAVMTEVVSTRQAEGDATLHLLDGLELFGEADLDLLPDGLHPNAEGYRLIAGRFYDLCSRQDLLVAP